MGRIEDKKRTRVQRRKRIRDKVYGTAERPRLSVFRSTRHIYAQIIDDDMGSVLASASTMDAQLRGSKKYGGNVDAAREVGKLLAERAATKKIEVVSFDRGGFKYHGRVKALAEAARDGGLKF
ncbi:MAG: 50S ribosomal protein L18 [bacterium]|nr:MAG: 50S ribosomal protein L18 [bacterium]